MERVMIIGSNGAGKSTFSYRLAEATGLPLTHIDQLYWRGSWEITPREEFERAVLAQARQPRWIIEGNNMRSLGQRMAYADTVLWFEFPPALCVWNILKREAHSRRRARPDMPPGCLSRLDMGFLKLAWNFNQKHRPTIEAALRAAGHVQVVRFTSYAQVRQFLRELPYQG